MLCCTWVILKGKTALEGSRHRQEMIKMIKMILREIRIGQHRLYT
jgi:hypothetical protein